MNTFKAGWFTETGVLNGDRFAVSVKVDKIVHQEKSKYQDIIVFDSPILGRCLILDNAIQCTEKDEFSYQEMMALLPLNSHPSPKKVLIVGGGDGGVAREVLRHPLVERVVLCEIDEAVIRASKEYLPFMSSAFDDPRLEVQTGDGLEFVKTTKERFDIVITDSSDPIGPAESLFNENYYESLFTVLESGGVICSQAEDFWFDIEVVARLTETCKKFFKSVSYASVLVPSYPTGQIGFLLGSKDLDRNFSCPVVPQDEAFLSHLRYYSREIHQSAFALPKFVKERLGL
jgi:spermidine synthase